MQPSQRRVQVAGSLQVLTSAGAMNVNVAPTPVPVPVTPTTATNGSPTHAAAPSNDARELASFMDLTKLKVQQLLNLCITQNIALPPSTERSKSSLCSWLENKILRSVVRSLVHHATPIKASTENIQRTYQKTSYPFPMEPAKRLEYFMTQCGPYVQPCRCGHGDMYVRWTRRVQGGDLGVLGCTSRNGCSGAGRSLGSAVKLAENMVMPWIVLQMLDVSRVKMCIAGPLAPMVYAHIVWPHEEGPVEPYTFPVQAYAQMVMQLKRLSKTRPWRAKLPHFNIFVDEVPSLHIAAAMSSSSAAPAPSSTLSNDRKYDLDVLPFQQEGITWILNSPGVRCLLCDDMGLGKTVQALGVIVRLHTWPVLIIAPASVRSVWMYEVEKWCSRWIFPQDVFCVMPGDYKAFDAKQTAKVVVTSYHMVEKCLAQWRAFGFQLVVCDESHLVFSKAGRSPGGILQASLEVVQNTPRCILMSGTPLGSSSSAKGLFYHALALRKDTTPLGWNYDHFCYRNFDTRGVCRRPEELSFVLKHALPMLKRTKAHVREQLQKLPQKQIVEVPITIEEKHANVLQEYDEVKTAFERIGIVKAHLLTSSSDAEKSWLALKLDACMSKCDDDVDEEHADSGAHPKCSEKVVIFVRHHRVADIIQKFLCCRGDGYVRVDGHLDGHDKTKKMRDFADDPAINIALCTVESCGTGVDALKVAHIGIFLEIPQAALYYQAGSRLHRIGQQSDVFLFVIVAQNKAIAPAPMSDAEQGAKVDARNGVDADDASNARLSWNYSGHWSRYDVRKWHFVQQDMRRSQLFFKEDASTGGTRREGKVAEKQVEGAPANADQRKKPTLSEIEVEDGVVEQELKGMPTNGNTLRDRITEENHEEERTAKEGDAHRKRHAEAIHQAQERSLWCSTVHGQDEQTNALKRIADDNVRDASMDKRRCLPSKESGVSNLVPKQSARLGRWESCSSIDSPVAARHEIKQGHRAATNAHSQQVNGTQAYDSAVEENQPGSYFARLRSTRPMVKARSPMSKLTYARQQDQSASWVKSHATSLFRPPINTTQTPPQDDSSIIPPHTSIMQPSSSSSACVHPDDSSIIRLQSTLPLQTSSSTSNLTQNPRVHQRNTPQSMQHHLHFPCHPQLNIPAPGYGDSRSNPRPHVTPHYPPFALPSTTGLPTSRYSQSTPPTPNLPSFGPCSPAAPPGSPFSQPAPSQSYFPSRASSSAATLSNSRCSQPSPPSSFLQSHASRARMPTLTPCASLQTIRLPSAPWAPSVPAATLNAYPSSATSVSHSAASSHEHHDSFSTSKNNHTSAPIIRASSSRSDAALHPPTMRRSGRFTCFLKDSPVTLADPIESGSDSSSASADEGCVRASSSQILHQHRDKGDDGCGSVRWIAVGPDSACHRDTGASAVPEVHDNSVRDIFGSRQLCDAIDERETCGNNDIVLDNSIHERDEATEARAEGSGSSTVFMRATVSALGGEREGRADSSSGVRGFCAMRSDGDEYGRDKSSGTNANQPSGQLKKGDENVGEEDKKEDEEKKEEKAEKEQKQSKEKEKEDDQENKEDKGHVFGASNIEDKPRDDKDAVNNSSKHECASAALTAQASSTRMKQSEPRPSHTTPRCISLLDSDEEDESVAAVLCTTLFPVPRSTLDGATTCHRQDEEAKDDGASTAPQNVETSRLVFKMNRYTGNLHVYRLNDDAVERSSADLEFLTFIPTALVDTLDDHIRPHAVDFIDKYSRLKATARSSLPPRAISATDIDAINPTQAPVCTTRVRKVRPSNHEGTVVVFVNRTEYHVKPLSGDGERFECFRKDCSQTARGTIRQLAPELAFFELFCEEKCHERHRLVTVRRAPRDLCYHAERGVCAECKVDTEEVRESILKAPVPEEVLPPHWVVGKRIRNAIQVIQEKSRRKGSRNPLWDADHITPVAQGGGSCFSSNFQTLCLHCHAEKTARDNRLTREQRGAKRTRRKDGAEVISEPDTKHEDDVVPQARTKGKFTKDLNQLDSDNSGGRFAENVE